MVIFLWKAFVSRILLRTCTVWNDCVRFYCKWMKTNVYRITLNIFENLQKIGKITLNIITLNIILWKTFNMVSVLFHFQHQELRTVRPWAGVTIPGRGSWLPTAVTSVPAYPQDRWTVPPSRVPPSPLTGGTAPQVNLISIVTSRQSGIFALFDFQRHR